MKTAKEILHDKCQEKGDCFLSGQIGWIVEAMEEYAKQEVETKVNKISLSPVLAEVPCPYCNGDGFTSEHNDMSRNYETGEHDCSQCPIQVQCEKCMATGKLKIQVG